MRPAGVAVKPGLAPCTTSAQGWLGLGVFGDSDHSHSGLSSGNPDLGGGCLNKGNLSGGRNLRFGNLGNNGLQSPTYLFCCWNSCDVSIGIFAERQAVASDTAKMHVLALDVCSTSDSTSKRGFKIWTDCKCVPTEDDL